MFYLSLPLAHSYTAETVQSTWLQHKSESLNRCMCNVLIVGLSNVCYRVIHCSSWLQHNRYALVDGEVSNTILMASAYTSNALSDVHNAYRQDGVQKQGLNVTLRTHTA